MNITNSIYRRLDKLKQITDKNRPSLVTVTYADGTAAVTTHGGALDLLREFGPRGELSCFQADGAMSEWARLMTGILHPAPDRRIEDFEKH